MTIRVSLGENIADWKPRPSGLASTPGRGDARI